MGLRFDPGPSPLRQLRKELGLSVPELARISKLPERVILKIEQGKPVSTRRVRRVYRCLAAELITASTLNSGDQSQPQAEAEVEVEVDGPLLEQLLNEYFKWRERLWKLLELEVAELLARVRISGGYR